MVGVGCIVILVPKGLAPVPQLTKKGRTTHSHEPPYSFYLGSNSACQLSLIYDFQPHDLISLHPPSLLVNLASAYISRSLLYSALRVRNSGSSRNLSSSRAVLCGLRIAYLGIPSLLISHFPPSLFISLLLPYNSLKQASSSSTSSFSATSILLPGSTRSHTQLLVPLPVSPQPSI